MGDRLATKTDGNASQPSVADREESLRRVAIVLDSLPAQTASMLLERVDGYSRHVIQQSIETLHSVAPEERQGILHSFKHRLSIKPTQADSPSPVVMVQAAGSVQDEIVLGQTDPATQPAAMSSARFGEQMAAFFPDDNGQAKSQRSHFQFLDSVSIEDQVTLLSGEHPQTIALVLSSISPRTAADILPRLNNALQKQTLSRIGRLSDVPESTTAEVAQHLQTRHDQLFAGASDCSGKRALQAIMDEMPDLANCHASPNARQNDGEPTKMVQSSSAAAAGLPDPSLNMFAQPKAGPVETTPLKIAESTRSFAINDLPVDGVADHTSNVDVSGQWQEDESARRDPAENAEDDQALVHAAHQHLLGLPAKDLVDALGRVSTRDAMLTLCGLPNSLAEAAISLLPRSKARDVRNGIESLGPLQLREIDAAKQAVALVSIGVSDAMFSSTTSQAA